MAKKLQQFYIVKLEARKILENNLNINYSLKEAKQNGTVVQVGDSQALRIIRQVVNRETDFKKLDELIKEKNRVKRSIKKYNEKIDIEHLFDVLKQIDNYLYVPEYIGVVSENKTQYNKIACRGFYVNGKLYKRFMCSAGNARNNTSFFILGDIFDEVVEMLQNGHGDIKIAEAKYNAYFSLSASATFQVSSPKFIVIPDCEVKRNEVIDNVVLKDDEYSIENKEKEITFNLFDGMGIVSPEQAQKWAQELELDYLPSGFLIRAPFIKGMVFVFDFHKFAYDVAGKKYIKDVWGIEHHVDDVELIITQSQFKLWNGYTSSNEYTNKMNKNGLSFGITKFPPKEDKTFIRTNYQFLQVLNLDTKEKIEGICKPTIDWLKGVVGGNENDIKLYLLGKSANFNDGNLIWKNIQDPFIKALMINSDVRQDKYIQNKIMQSIQKKIKESYIGKLIVEGNFQVMISDPYALCEHMFGMEVKGLLNRNQYYSKYWNDRNINTVAGMRSPLTWRSEVNKLNLINNENTSEWYKYLYSGIVYNVFGYDCLIHAGSDFDGDIVCTTSNKYFIENCYGGVPVLGEHQSPQKNKININTLYKYDGKAFSTKIGFITNCSTTLYEMLKLYEVGSKEHNAIMERLKLCCHFQALQIDSAKGIVVQSMPHIWYNKQHYKNDETDKSLMNKINFDNNIAVLKRPYFMRYLYSNYNREYTQYQENYNQMSIALFGNNLNEVNDDIKLTKEYKDILEKYNKYNKFLDTNGVMNNICHYMESACKDIKFFVKQKNDENFFKKYMDNTVDIDNEKLKLMLGKFEEYSKQKKNRKCLEEGNSFLKYCMNLKDEILGISIDIRELANLAVYICYVIYPKKPKDFAWDICGDGIIENLFYNKGSYSIEIPMINNKGDVQYLGQEYKVEEIKLDNDNI